MENANRIIAFNVDGTKHLTSLSTLQQAPGNLLLAMVAGRVPVATYEGAIFIDRDGELFRWILDYLRNVTNWSLPNSVPVEALQREADFYLLPTLVQFLNRQSTAREGEDSTIIIDASEGENNVYNDIFILASNLFLEQHGDKLVYGRIRDVKSDLLANMNTLFTLGYRLVNSFIAIKTEYDVTMRYIFQLKE